MVTRFIRDNYKALTDLLGIYEENKRLKLTLKNIVENISIGKELKGDNYGQFIKQSKI